MRDGVFKLWWKPLLEFDQRHWAKYMNEKGWFQWGQTFYTLAGAQAYIRKERLDKNPGWKVQVMRSG